MAQQMTFRQFWWTAAVSGIAAIVFGLLALLWPGLTLFILILLFGIYAIVDGIMALVAMARAMSAGQDWWPMALRGAFGILAGLAALFWPGATTVTLLYIIALWAIVVGIVEAVFAVMTGHLFAVAVGTVAILFGLLLLANPGAGALALVVVIGAFAIVRGVLLLLQTVRAPV